MEQNENIEQLKEYREKIANLSEEEKRQRDIYLSMLAKGDIQGPSVGYPALDKTWLRNYSSSSLKIEIPKKSIYQLLKETCKKRANKIALTFANFKIKYKEYDKKINKYAKAYKHLNVSHKEIVLVMLPNIPESRQIIYASNITGVIPYCVTPMVSPEHLTNIIKENNIKNVFTFNQFYKKYYDVFENECESIKNIVISDGMESLPPVLKPILRKKTKSEKIESSKVMSFEKFSKLGLKDPEVVPYYEENMPAVIIGTSGTTGTSKGVVLTNENLNAMALQHQFGDMNFKEGEKLLDILIQSIGYGIAVAHYSGVCGLNSILVPDLVTDIYPLLLKYKPQHFTGGPIHYNGLASRSDVDLMKLCSFTKNMVSGGATLEKKIELQLNSLSGVSEEKRENVDEEKVLVRQGLGCTENGGASTYAKMGAYKLNGIGIPLFMENMSIFKPGTDEELPYYCEGEICVTGPTVMKEYLNNPSETNNVLKRHSDGKLWLHTCDLGYCDRDGQFYITDRIKNIFMRKGFNVHPSRINDLIMSNNLVEESIVYGVDHPDEQTVPVAFIKLKDTNISNAREIIMNECIKKLEEPSVPYDIIFVDSLPRNLGGKVEKNKLLEEYNIDYSKKMTNR